MIFPGNVICFLSISEDRVLIAAARSELVIDPKSLSPDPTFEGSLISSDLISFALLFLSYH